MCPKVHFWGLGLGIGGTKLFVRTDLVMGGTCPLTPSPTHKLRIMEQTPYANFIQVALPLHFQA